jgi:uncharacterized protein YciI
MLFLAASPLVAVQNAPAAATVEMTTYQMVLLRAGAGEPPAARLAAMQQEHLANLAKLNRDRVNLLYGPFTDAGTLRGIAILDVADAAAARKLFDADPFVKGGFMTVDVKPWHGPKNWFHLPLDPPTPENFVLGFLMRGPNTSQSSDAAAEIQKGHLAYMDQLHAQGKLALAGPFGDDGPMRGIVLYRVATVDEAKQLAAGDPAVKAGRLVIDARPWMTFKGMLK